MLDVENDKNRENKVLEKYNRKEDKENINNNTE
jgi:hypothetical protein